MMHGHPLPTDLDAVLLAKVCVKADMLLLPRKGFVDALDVRLMEVVPFGARRIDRSVEGVF